ncbi:Phage tail assembly chaperone protein [Pseudomonas guariconensis]|uniref:phage tail assembly chaperone n=1 Tax=Pseudomonas guariconensis TaxID=1288410 RepID=UPI0008831C4F|nr:phage tail assembly chaperone [Pseudomonas guariconensis]SDC64515.1 Phage tail assembly chaperone protein [Pseudomonas guariconensis]
MWALIVDGAVREVTEIDPAGRFHPTLTWVGCGAEVAPGDRYDDGAFWPPLAADPAEAERSWRDGEIAAHEWLVSRHRAEVELQRDTTLTAEQYAELLQYLQALRDWPAAEAFPDSAQRPVAPLWIAEQTQ